MEEEVSDYTEMQVSNTTLDLNAVLDPSANVGNPPWYDNFVVWMIIAVAIMVIPVLGYWITKLVGRR